MYLSWKASCCRVLTSCGGAQVTEFQVVASEFLQRLKTSGPGLPNTDLAKGSELLKKFQVHSQRAHILVYQETYRMTLVYQETYRMTLVYQETYRMALHG